jgi:stage V sporulation protein G
MAELSVTDFRNIRYVTSGKLRAFVDVVFNDALVVKGFKVIEGSRGLFVAAPAREQKNKETGETNWNDVVYWNKESNAWSGIQSSILKHYQEGLAEAGTKKDI